jgi:hypothetical protein
MVPAALTPIRCPSCVPTTTTPSFVMTGSVVTSLDVGNTHLAFGAPILGAGERPCRVGQYRAIGHGDPTWSPLMSPQNSGAGGGPEPP